MDLAKSDLCDLVEAHFHIFSEVVFLPSAAKIHYVEEVLVTDLWVMLKITTLKTVYTGALIIFLSAGLRIRDVIGPGPALL